MSRQMPLLAVAALMMAWGVSDLAMAQSGQTSSGMFGSRTIGGGVSARNGTAFGSTGGTGTPGQQTTQGQENVGQITGTERFLRDARQPGQFVGADSGDTRAFNSMQQAMGGGIGGNRMTTGPLSQFNQLNQLMRGGQFGNMQNQQGGRGGNAQSRVQVPIALRLGFEPPTVPVAQVQTRVERRIDRAFNSATTITNSRPRNAARANPAPANSALASRVNITVQGRTAVLRGEVATEHERTLAEKLAMMEPGVSAVQNDLTVASRP